MRGDHARDFDAAVYDAHHGDLKGAVVAADHFVGLSVYGLGGGGVACHGGVMGGKQALVEGGKGGDGGAGGVVHGLSLSVSWGWWWRGVAPPSVYCNTESPPCQAQNCYKVLQAIALYLPLLALELAAVGADLGGLRAAVGGYACLPVSGDVGAVRVGAGLGVHGCLSLSLGGGGGGAAPVGL